MESGSGSSVNTTITTIIPTATTTTTTLVAVASSNAAAGSTAGSDGKNNAALLVASGASNSSGSTVVSVLPPSITSKQQQQPQQQQQSLQLDTKQEEANNLSLASLLSEGQRSHSGAPSASSSPILSPPGKIFGRNANGTMIATSRPSNEAEVQLYRVLQRASLLAYYDTLLEMGGDDVQQLYEAGEEEFLEIMALVGMASKPLHVRRLQKVLHEWANNPSIFQGPMLSGTPGLCDTPTKMVTLFNPEPFTPASSSTRAKFPSIAHTFNPTPLISTVQTTSTHTQSTTLPTPTPLVPSLMLPHTTLPLPTASSLGAVLPQQQPPSGITSGITSHQVTSSSPQLTPVLTEMQVARITLGAEKIARQLPQREPRAQTSKKRTSRELEQVIAMSEHDPRRMDEIRKYSAIYGRFDCKRRPEKPLTLHEVCVNEAAAQLCRLVPALLTRRDELFPLARQIVKDAGFGHSASIARYGGLVPQIQGGLVQQQQRSIIDCESSLDELETPKRPRLSSTETTTTTTTTTDFNRDNLDDSRYNLFAMYQKFAKPPFDLTDIAKFSQRKSDYDDIDNDSRFSFSNSSSPSMPQNNGSENDREFTDGSGVAYAADSVMKSPSQRHPIQLTLQSSSPKLTHTQTEHCSMDTLVMTTSPLAGVQVLSAAGGQIIAVANPALALSPTLNDALSIKREIGSPELFNAKFVLNGMP